MQGIIYQRCQVYDHLILDNVDAVRSDYEKVTIASSGTDIFVTALYHYTKWIYINLQELWMICRKGETSRVIPLHDVVTKLENTVTDSLPVLHALTGCDLKTNSSKFGGIWENIDAKTSWETFDELRMKYYHCESKFNLEKIPPTSASIHKHIQ